MADTRDRILDTALELFIEKGYDAVSLREIAARVGVTKAALYYHFASKDEIFRTLVLPLREVTGTLLSALDEPATPAAWARGWEALLTLILPRRRLIELMRNNHAKLHELEPELHDEESHRALRERLAAVLMNEALPLGDRVRMAGSIGLVMGVLAFPADGGFSRVPHDELQSALLAAIRDVLRVP